MSETLIQFTDRLCKNVGCYYHVNKSKKRYSIQKHNSTKPKHMGVFGWVSERKGIESFRISTYKKLGDKAGVTGLADEIKQGLEYGQDDGLIFYVRNGSNSNDYQKVVKALRAILPFV